jgi:hypothetical protein
VATLSLPTFDVFEDICQENNGDSELSQLHDAIRGGAKPEQWSVVDGLILFKGRIFIAPSSGLLPTILRKYFA